MSDSMYKVIELIGSSTELWSGLPNRSSRKQLSIYVNCELPRLSIRIW